jgi:hypothetical protein
MISYRGDVCLRPRPARSRVCPLQRAQGTITQIPGPASLYTNELIDPSIRMRRQGR